MESMINYQRLNPDTVNGEMLVITITFSTFNYEEMNEFEKSIKEKLGYGQCHIIRKEKEK